MGLGTDAEEGREGGGKREGGGGKREGGGGNEGGGREGGRGEGRREGGGRSERGRVREGGREGGREIGTGRVSFPGHLATLVWNGVTRLCDELVLVTGCEKHEEDRLESCVRADQTAITGSIGEFKREKVLLSFTGL